MKLIIFALLPLVSKVLMFQQDEYKVIFEHAEIIRHNSSYVDVATAHNFKYNRTQAVTNVTVRTTRNLGFEVQIEVQAYKFTSNEYRLFPIRWSFDFCDYAKKNELGLAELFVCANISGCPLTKRVYNFCNWKPNSQKFPPHIPQGSYMADLKFIYRNVEILFFQVYGTIKYPEIKGFSFF